MKYVCDVCGWEYDEENGYPEGGIAPGTKWEDIPDDFECPLCFVGKDQFSVLLYNTVFISCTRYFLILPSSISQLSTVYRIIQNAFYK